MSRPDKYSKLSNEQKLEIIRLNSESWSYTTIAHYLQLPRKTVADFMNRNGKKNQKWWMERDLALSSAFDYPETKFPTTLLGKFKIPRETTPEFTFQMGRIENKKDTGLRIIVIPDTQVKPESDISHIIAAGNYIADQRPDVVVVIGDWWDCSSLNNYGTALELSGRRVLDDLEAGKNAMWKFLETFNNTPDYKPRLVFTVGNHDPQVRIPRFVSEHPKLDGLLVDDTSVWLAGLGFEVYEYLDIVNIEGIRFSHYFQNPHSAKKAPLSGQIDAMIKNAGFSFVQGHTQVYKHGKHYLGDGSKRIGLVCGSFSQDIETYMGAQGAHVWQGVCVLNEVKDGGADICEVSLNYLLREWQ